VVDKTLFLFSNSLVPLHCQVPLDEGLRHFSLLKHLQVGSSLLSGEDIALHLHDGMLLDQEFLSAEEGPESGLNFECSIGFAVNFIKLVLGSGDVATHS